MNITRGVGRVVAGAAQAVLLDPQDLSGVLWFLLAARTASVLPLEAARQASAGGGVEGLGLGLGGW